MYVYRSIKTDFYRASERQCQWRISLDFEDECSTNTPRTRDLNSDAVIAGRSIKLLQQLFDVPPFPNLLDRWVEVIVINDAIWALSIHRHGTIADEMEEQALRARIAYARTFLPEYLPLRANW